MTRTNLAALALLAGVAIAAPAVICSAADSEMQTAQAQTTAQPPSDQPAQDTPGMGGMRGMMGREGMGPMGHRMREMMNRSPKDRCEERLARRAGFIAYTVAKLNLTAQQNPLWDKLNATIPTAGEKERQPSQKPPAEASAPGQVSVSGPLERP